MGYRFLALSSLILIVFCTPEPYVKGQTDPCRKIDIKKDPFGKEMRSKAIFQGMGYLGVGIYQLDGKNYLQMLFTMGGFVNAICPTGTPGKVALVDGTIIEMTSCKDSGPIKRANSQTIYTQWVIDFEIDNPTLAQLSNSPIKAVQSMVNNQPLQLEISESDGYTLQEAADCLSQ